MHCIGNGLVFVSWRSVSCQVQYSTASNFHFFKWCGKIQKIPFLKHYAVLRISMKVFGPVPALNLLWIYFFGGLECIGYSFAYVARIWFFKSDVWIWTQRACRYKQARYQLPSYPYFFVSYSPVFRIQAVVKSGSNPDPSQTKVFFLNFTIINFTVHVFLNPYTGRWGSRRSLQHSSQRALQTWNFVLSFGDNSASLDPDPPTLLNPDPNYIIFVQLITILLQFFFFRDAGQAVVQNAFCEPGRPDHNQAKVNFI